MAARRYEDGIRGELKRLQGERVLIFLEGIQVEGTLEEVGRDIVTLRVDATDPVKVSTSSKDLKEMVLAKIRIRKILAVGPGMTSANH
ncbi:hypothetical protein PP175_02345 [Aneurinibacillus sp. Ricciae_BoGa-3]|uniref:hypothetical protein n=1 Tax=Aneurinibacillus sp. Ricciae_BoGa-3 TaxID=3022697 RepID=UPI0023400234|nr:hypothetical protein [Aneurinibacillus sp. Ricciae_BoGa-3]WCK54875.1 hypothetical protein PP175_02345 [Aneurinibacillus sp. Ricciae_BoGa-3]